MGQNRRVLADDLAFAVNRISKLEGIEAAAAGAATGHPKRGTLEQGRAEMGVNKSCKVQRWKSTRVSETKWDRWSH